MRLVKSSFIASHLQSKKAKQKNETECGICIPITYVVIRKENVNTSFFVRQQIDPKIPILRT